MAQRTRLGAYGGPRAAYGSFSGKTAVAAITVVHGQRTPNTIVAVYSGLPGRQRIATLDINPRITNVEIETVIPGGFGVARIGLLAPDSGRPSVYPYLPEPVEAEDKSHVEVHVGSHLAHEGILRRMSANRQGVETLGYGIAATQWGGIDTPGGTDATSQAIVIEALNDIPWLTTGTIEATGNRHNWSEFYRRSAAEVLETIAREGGGDPAQPWLFTVYDGRVVSFRAKIAPVVPDYRLAYDPGQMDLEWDYSEVYDAVRFVFRVSAGVDQVTPWLYRDGVNPVDTYLRRKTLTGSVDSAGTALQILRTFLAEHSQPRMRGVITLSGGDGLQVPSGAERPGYLARAGEWIEITGYGIAPIMRTRAVLEVGPVEIELGEPSPSSLAGMITRALESESALRSKKDPVSSLNWRF